MDSDTEFLFVHDFKDVISPLGRGLMYGCGFSRRSDGSKWTTFHG